MKIVFDVIYDLLFNFPLIVALAAMITAQTIKIIYYLIKDKKLNFGHFLEAGGMPSAHSAMVSALTISVGFTMGWTSPALAIALIFSLVVMYDAMGVRRAASKQAYILNKLVDDIYNDGNAETEKLKEIMGHSPIEVFVGSVFGVLVGIISYILIYVL